MLSVWFRTPTARFYRTIVAKLFDSTNTGGNIMIDSWPLLTTGWTQYGQELGSTATLPSQCTDFRSKRHRQHDHTLICTDIWFGSLVILLIQVTSQCNTEEEKAPLSAPDRKIDMESSHLMPPSSITLPCISHRLWWMTFICWLGERAC